MLKYEYVAGIFGSCMLDDCQGQRLLREAPLTFERHHFGCVHTNLTLPTFPISWPVRMAAHAARS